MIRILGRGLFVVLFLVFQINILQPFQSSTPESSQNDWTRSAAASAKSSHTTNANVGNDSDEDNSASTRHGKHQSTSSILADWRVVTDCTIYDFTCPLTHSFKPYPFTPLLRHSLDSISLSSLQSQETAVNHTRTSNAHYIEYIDPPKVPPKNIQSCLESARQSLPTQLKQMIESLNPISINDQEGSTMVAFTITDETYAREMIHEVVQMNRHVVQFDRAHFLVAMDPYSLEQACDFGYPVVYYQTDTETDPTTKMETNKTDTKQVASMDHGEGVTTSTRALVQGSKLIVSQLLVNLNQGFMFYEMDIWFQQSPLPTLRNEMTSEDDVDVLMSTHQNNHGAPNIGFYAVRATNATREYFDTCVKLLEQYPHTHDQAIMVSVADLNTELRNGNDAWSHLQLHDDDGKKVEVSVPKVEHPIVMKKLNPHVIPSHEWPVPTERTVAMHFLANKPLRHPFGKIMMAKETGLWYGFHSVDSSTPLDESDGRLKKSDVEETDKQTPLAGYYARTGKYRRYLLLDDDGTLGGHSMQQGSDYHSEWTMRWKIAILVTLAQWTNRILILPKVMVDRDVRFLWTQLDMSSLQDLGVEFRETNFPSNRKSWFRSDLPFSSIARVALYPNGKLFLQTSNKTELEMNMNGEIQGWDIEDEKALYLDVLFALLSRVDVDNTEALFINPSELSELVNFAEEKAPALNKVQHVYRRELRWCDNPNPRLVETFLAPVHARSTSHCYMAGVTEKNSV